MKKDRLQLIMITLFCTVILVGILVLCFFNNNNNGKNYRSDIYNTFQIDIPEEWESLYFNQGSLGGFAGEGTAYYVFQVTERNEEFFSEFSQTKDAEFENCIQDVKESNFDNYSPSDPIELDYLYNIEQPYEWFVKEVGNTIDENLVRKRQIIFIYQSQKLYIFAKY